MDITLGLMSGNDIPIPECQIAVHQPRIKEIGFIGEEQFFLGSQTLCLDKQLYVKDESALSSVNNFQIFMTIMSKKETAEKKLAVQQLLTILFPKHQPLFTPKSFILNGEKESILIDENNFGALQAALKQILCLRSGPSDKQGFNPANSQAAEIAKKLMRGRQIAAEQKGGANGSIFSQYISILSIGLHFPVSELLNCTIFQIYDLYERYQLFMAWDIDIRSRLAGGKPDDRPDNWMKNIH